MTSCHRDMKVSIHLYHSMDAKAAKVRHYHLCPQVLKRQGYGLQPFPDGCDDVRCYLHYPNLHVEVDDGVVDDTKVYVDDGEDSSGDGGSGMDIPNSMVNSSPNTNLYSNDSCTDSPNSMENSNRSTSRM